MMEKRFYFSTRIDRSSEATALLNALRSQGWERTYVWSDQTVNPDKYSDVATAELEGIGLANVVIILLPGGYGTHAEIGAALALGKPVILHSPDHNTMNTPYPCVFHYHPLINLIVSEVVDVKNLIDLMTILIENRSA
jgi:nucleoside 2-deoxyribosyltransferase